MKPKITIVCAHCGSENVGRDATARWSVSEQCWSLSDVQDQGFCDDCDSSEATLHEKELGQ